MQRATSRRMVLNNYAWNAEELLASAAGVTYSTMATAAGCKNPPGQYWYGRGMKSSMIDASGNITADYIFFGGRRVARRDSSGAIFHVFF